MRIVLSGGGTGGHIYPALAIAKQAHNHDILYIGTNKGLESKWVPHENIPFRSIEITGLQRRLTWENVRTLIRFFKSVKESKRILKEFKPDLVLGTGGYVCGPVLYAASRLGIATMIHEQNVIPGITNRFLSRYVDCIAVSFKESEAHFQKAQNVVHTGNPCATIVQTVTPDQGYEFLGLSPEEEYVVVVGGSRGAKILNDCMIQMAKWMTEENSFHIVYVTGEIYYEKTMEQLQGHSNKIHIFPYIHPFSPVLAGAKLFIGRSGASILAEITSLGLPAILIPSPNVTNNHQTVNALALKKVGAAVVIPETELDARQLFEEILNLMKDARKRKMMAELSRSLGEPEAAKQIWHEMKRVMEIKKVKDRGRDR